MSLKHKKLAAGAWSKMSLIEQLANVGSELERTISWRQKGNEKYSQEAFERMLELLALTKNSCKDKARLGEVARVYELLVDYFQGENIFGSTDELWRKYFSSYTYLAAIIRKGLNLQVQPKQST
jgi:hypothetical protein